MLYTLLKIPYVVLKTTAILTQIQLNRKRRSVYGLSLDSILWSIVGYSSSIIETSAYKVHAINMQYKKRYPLYPKPPTLICELVVDIFMTISYSCLAYQCFYQFKRTHNIFQGISWVALSLLGGLWVIDLILFYGGIYHLPESDLGYYGIKLLDCVEWVATIGYFGQAVRLFPQICLNWGGKCTIGMSGSWPCLELTASLFYIPYLYSVFKTKADNQWYISYIFIVLISMVCNTTLIVQHLYIYRGRKALLSKKYKYDTIHPDT